MVVFVYLFVICSKFLKEQKERRGGRRGEENEGMSVQGKDWNEMKRKNGMTKGWQGRQAPKPASNSSRETPPQGCCFLIYCRHRNQRPSQLGVGGEGAMEGMTSS